MENIITGLGKILEDMKNKKLGKGVVLALSKNKIGLIYLIFVTMVKF